jgi:hypothetical protein
LTIPTGAHPSYPSPGFLLNRINCPEYEADPLFRFSAKVKMYLYAPPLANVPSGFVLSHSNIFLMMILK